MTDRGTEGSELISPVEPAPVPYGPDSGNGKSLESTKVQRKERGITMQFQKLIKAPCKTLKMFLCM